MQIDLVAIEMSVGDHDAQWRYAVDGGEYRRSALPPGANPRGDETLASACAAARYAIDRVHAPMAFAPPAGAASSAADRP